MQQAGSDHFVLAKLRRDVLKYGVAVGLRYGFGGLHTVEFVGGQSQLVQWGHGKRSTKNKNAATEECPVLTQRGPLVSHVPSPLPRVPILGAPLRPGPAHVVQLRPVGVEQDVREGAEQPGSAAMEESVDL
ncbi:MAG: hypothetical protein WCB74_12215 [Pseudolabrys sp.]